MNNNRIRDILGRDNYANSEWEKRGLTPSGEDVINLLTVSTNDFLHSLASLSCTTDMNQLNFQVQRLVDALPWDRLDREEKEFLAAVLSPAIEGVGLDPWQLF